MTEVKNVIKIKIKQFFCTHTANESSEDINYKILKDSFEVPYILRTCIKCEKQFRTYMKMAQVNMNLKNSIDYPKNKTRRTCIAVN